MVISTPAPTIKRYRSSCRCNARAFSTEFRFKIIASFTFPVLCFIVTAVQATQAELVKAELVKAELVKTQSELVKSSSETESCRQTIESLMKEVSEVEASPPHQCL